MMNSFAFGKHSRKFPNCLSPLYVWKVSFKSTWTLVAYFQMVATVHPCLPRVPHFARPEHGNVSWWKLAQGFVQTWQRWDFCYFDSQPKILSFFDYEFFPAELAEGRFQTWIRLVWVVLICGKISDWCWSCSIHARKIGADPWNISQKYTKSKEIVGQIFIWLKVVHDPVHCGVLSDLFLSRFPLKCWILRQEETFYSIVSYYH